MTNPFHCIICGRDVEIEEVNHLIDHDERVLVAGIHPNFIRKQYQMIFLLQIMYRII
jgi:hypothetical protein